MTGTLYSKHVERWIDCKKCPLHKCRKRVVLARGTIPCYALFIGEAPGESENALGKPFIGPAGKLLDEIILRAWGADPEHSGYSRAFTNLVCCIPRGDDGKLSQPYPEEIEACRSRLIEFINICRPKLLIAVGRLAESNIPIMVPKSVQATIQITHPAAILRMPVAQQGLEVQRAVVTLTTALEDLISC